MCIVGVEFLRADGQTNGRTDERMQVTKLIVVFRNFANASKNNQNYPFFCRDMIALFVDFTKNSN
jgi:hypothetical protein